MKPDRLMEVLGQAAQKPAPDERARFVDRVCQDEPELRAQLAALLSAHEEAKRFLKYTSVPGASPSPAAAASTEGPVPRALSRRRLRRRAHLPARSAIGSAATSFASGAPGT